MAYFLFHFPAQQVDHHDVKQQMNWSIVKECRPHRAQRPDDAVHHVRQVQHPMLGQRAFIKIV